MNLFRGVVLTVMVAVSLCLCAQMASANGGPGESVCESRRGLTIEQRSKVGMFRSRLSRLDRLRELQSFDSEAYTRQLNAILTEFAPRLTAIEEREKAIEYVLFEQLKQTLFELDALESDEYVQFERIARQVQFFSAVGPRALMRATSILRNSIRTQIREAAPFQTPHAAASRLQDAVRAERALLQLELVYAMLLHNVWENKQSLQDRMSMYRQFFTSIFGATAVVGTIVASAPVVATAGAAFATTGLVLAGCSIGAVGGGAAALLEAQYGVYANAYDRSVTSRTAFSCELRRGLESGGQTEISAQAIDGFASGAVAGCVLTAASFIAPRITTYSVVGAVAIATGIEVAGGVRDGVLAGRSYLIYRSLMAYQAGEEAAIAGQAERALAYLNQSRGYALQAGAHSLSAVLAGLVLPGIRANMAQAFASGREAIVTLIGMSADNAAVALRLLVPFLSSPEVARESASSKSRQLSQQQRTVTPRRLRAQSQSPVH